MAYTDKNIIDAYNEAMAGGATEAQFVDRAKSMGISNDQLASARSQLTPASDRFTPEQYGAARDWSNGKTWAEISGKASELGLTSGELGKVFGEFGGSGQQVQNLTGYGTGANGFNPDGSLKYNTSFGGALADGSKPADWTFDSASGWNKADAKKMPNPGMPSTGINLSQLQQSTPWDVTANQTVASQLEQILATDSPLLQQARMRAMQTANQRGLLNSSMAASAGESALYDAALPIAQQDATTYSNAGRFNAETANTFSRDNNAFTRDAFMADFNLAANEWAKKQDQLRELDKLNANQRLTLERDAIQNGYQSARDAILNGYTLGRDQSQNAFTAQQADLDRQAAMARVAAGQSADTSLERMALQLNADRDVNALKVQQGSRDTITNARGQLNKDLISINSASGLSTEIKDQMLSDAINSYNTIVNGHLSSAGWKSDDWSYKVVPAPTTEKAPEQPSAVPERVGGDGA